MAAGRKSRRQNESEYDAAALPSLRLNPSLAVIVMSFNHVSNVERIANALRIEPSISTIVVAEDGSTDGSKEAWARALRASDRMVHSNDVHEIRAYNLGAKATNASVLCFLQDDDVPSSPGWAGEVVWLFERFRRQRLGVLSGLAAEVYQVELGEQQVDHPSAMNNLKKTQPIPWVATGGDYLRVPLPLFKPVPFAFVTEAWLSPMCVRRDVWDALGGFDETLTKPGEPGIGLDIHLSLRALQELGVMSGVHGATFERGVGGHGTVTSPEKAALRLRKRSEISNRIQQIAGCRWPPPFTERAAALNQKFLKKRVGDSFQSTRANLAAKAAEFAKRPCKPPTPH